MSTNGFWKIKKEEECLSMSKKIIENTRFVMKLVFLVNFETSFENVQK